MASFLLAMTAFQAEVTLYSPDQAIASYHRRLAGAIGKHLFRFQV
jgi:hypothetical protein